ncbi:hypothetical protein A2380_02790 [candidate division WWE3 bacterium RIFOXYB1_FULL_43_24]|uniref:YokE-like PH domain-containing protein n=2 Tax=Katanobacteria TaxID=422282 RepID=A0A0G1AUS3_UNCKA|nr:MAG: hypothetical protein UU92_C0007G0057 [candidate division WWE3 bacterium GW2011_GWA1_42_12]KKS34734.1 MAG: hypothetical protein UU97_C0007G0024 [candidate division WWE3 bacterium GW2011_GWD1_42_14]KKS37841.1 MAG: hypothetical protein UV00_C0011G0024 [candidate division WWE3 bacterium GW2011_GWF1_42_14]KKS40207.1 MAG: hypothetical protein UV03_C0010G0024 [candidate division WWE3 bacterium GW2011_GWE1_42_16]KKS66184.1 MAG: hypothetical protein UV35_C0023G0012 [candidate division WWE3 bacte
MDTIKNSQNGDISIRPETPPTPQETETLQIQEEGQLADRKDRLNKTTVEGLVRKSNRILVSISSHRFPFDFFPDTLNVEEGRITVITRQFFFNSQVHSVDIKDISNIFINMTFLYAQLEIVSRTFEDNEIKIFCLRKKEAIFARRLVEGLRIFESKQIDTSNYSKEELISKLQELSATKIVT